MEYNPMWATEAYSSGVILPYFWNKEEKEGYYLMGHDEKEGIGENIWSGLGGYREEEEDKDVNGEGDPRKTAQREGKEESAGLIDIFLEANNSVEFIDKEKFFIYVVDLSLFYDEEQIKFFSRDFAELRKQELPNNQKEKSELGWMKASKIVKEISLKSPRHTIYEQPFANSIIITENASLRTCQHWFFQNVIYSAASCMQFKNGWRNLTGHTVNVIRDRNRGNSTNFSRLNNNNFKIQPSSNKNNLSALNPNNGNEEQTAKYIKPWQRVSAVENFSEKSPIVSSEILNNTARKPKPWDKVPTKDNLSAKSTNVETDVLDNSSPKPKPWDNAQKK